MDEKEPERIENSLLQTISIASWDRTPEEVTRMLIPQQHQGIASIPQKSAEMTNVDNTRR